MQRLTSLAQETGINHRKEFVCTTSRKLVLLTNKKKNIFFFWIKLLVKDVSHPHAETERTKRQCEAGGLRDKGSAPASLDCLRCDIVQLLLFSVALPYLPPSVYFLCQLFSRAENFSYLVLVLHVTSPDAMAIPSRLIAGLPPSSFSQLIPLPSCTSL